MPAGWRRVPGTASLCEYIIVDDEELLPGVFDSITLWAGQPKTRESPPPGNPPKAYIIMLVNSALEAEFGATRRVTTYDVGMSAENMILVALEQGVGTCPILLFRESELKRILNIPDNYDVALVLAMGYPDESPVTEVSSGPVEVLGGQSGRAPRAQKEAGRYNAPQ